MLDIDYKSENGGWQRPIIRPNEPLMLEPANATLHYCVECFEGLKAYVTHDKKVMLFRADKNCERLNRSHRQLGFPEFDVKEMLECLKELVRTEKDWIPDRPLHSLYLRPTSISMDNRLSMSKI